jgi:hypothetical protein
VAIVEKPGLRLPRLRLPLTSLPLGVRIAAIVGILLATLLLARAPQAVAVLQAAFHVLVAVAAVGFAALVASALMTRRSTDARLDRYLARQAEDREQPVVEPLERT